MIHRTLRFALLASCVTTALACQRATPSAASRETPTAEPSTPPTSSARDSAEAGRIVAIGDVHGDLASAREALALAGAIDQQGNWAGGDLVLVQMGDQTDRGDDEIEILRWFIQLREQAQAAGGAFHILLGNHEVMNVQLDLRYVTPGGFEDFADVPVDPSDPMLAQVPEGFRGRAAAFRPGGPWAMRLSEHPVVLVLGDTVFVHGGLEPELAALGVDTINASVRAWMRGEAEEPAVVRGDDSPIWSRDYSYETGPEQCAALAQTLDSLGVARMVVGHTVQRDGITSACDGRVWRVDVGLADYYGGVTQVLQIVGDEVTVIR